VTCNKATGREEASKAAVRVGPSRRHTTTTTCFTDRAHPLL
jgi:hypothetical protein